MAQAAPTYNYETEQSDLIRRQKIADAMIAQGMTPMGPTETAAGGIAVKRSPLEGVAKVLQAYMGKQSTDKINAQETALGNRYQADLKSGMNDLITGMNAQPGAVAESQGNNPSAFVPGHTNSMADAMEMRRKAVMEAIASNHPVLKDLGMSMLKQQQAGMLTGKDLKDLATPESVIAHPNNPELWVPKVTFQQIVPGQVTADAGGVLRDPTPAKPVAPAAPTGVQVPGSIAPQAVPGQPAAPVGPAALQSPAAAPGQPPNPQVLAPQGPGADIPSPRGPAPNGWKMISSTPAFDTLSSPSGDLYQRTATGLKQLDNATKVTVNNGQNEAANELAKMRVGQLKESYEATKTVPQALSTLSEARQALDAGIKSGSTADIALTLSKVAKSLGMGDVDPAIANTEQFRANMAKAVLPIVEKLKPASDKDVEYAKQAAGGQITLDDQALLRLLKIGQAAAYNQLLGHQRFIDNNRNAPGMQAGDIDTFQVPFHFQADPKDFTYSKDTGQFTLAGPPPVAGPKAGLQAPTVSNWPGSK